MDSSNLVFYGAGVNMRNLLHLFDASGIPFNYTIWDMNAENIKSINGHDVFLPDFKTKVFGKKAVITIDDAAIARSVEQKLCDIGFDVIRGENGFLDFINTRQTIDKNEIMKTFPVEFTEFDRELIYSIHSDGLSMVQYTGLFATLLSCKYVVSNNIEGDFVECGVWRGGNAMIAAMVFKHYGSSKKVWLFDTFEGFTNVKHSKYEKDLTLYITLDEIHQQYYDPYSCGNSLDDVKANFEKYGVLNDNIVFVKGDVIKTLASENIPKQISALRLDTDLYDSTLKELQVLYPRLSGGGVIMIDDYGVYEGLRAAVEEYFEKISRPLLQVVNHGIRLAVKVFD